MLIFILLFISLFVVSCTTGPTGSISLKSIFDKIISIGKLDFLGMTGESAISGFMRIMIFILVFTVLYEASRFLGASDGTRVTISLIISIISCIFIPKTVLIAIGTSYGLIVSLFLIGSVIVGGFFAIFQIPRQPWYWHLTRIGVLCLLLWLLLIMKDNAIKIAGLP